MKIRHFFRTLKLAKGNFFANGKRNFLSILTVILGSLAIGAVFTVNENVDVFVESLIARSGGPNLFITLKGDSLYFDNADLVAMRAMSSSRYVSRDMQAGVTAKVEGRFSSVSALCADEFYNQARPIQMIEGQFLSKWDDTTLSRNVVLSPDAAAKLGLDDPIGKQITLFNNGRNFSAHVIGIAKPLYDTNDRGLIWMPVKFFESLTQLKGASNLIVGFSSYNDLEVFQGRVAETLRPKFRSNFEIYNPKGNFEAMRKDYNTFTAAGAIIGLLSLLAGSVGVMNMMIVGIRLRTREIGLYRALGFSTGVVLMAFITESLMILSSGGLIGSVLGVFFGVAIASQVVTTPPFVSYSAFLLALASSFIIGFVFSYFPARQASAMDTVEALRT